MSKTQHQELRERLIEDGVLLSIKPFGLNLTGYKIEPLELKAVQSYGDLTFKFIVRGTRIEKIADSYTMVFFYKTKGYNTSIENSLNDFLNPQMTLGTPEDRYEHLKQEIQRIHLEYVRDSKDVDIFVLDFRTKATKYGEDREGIDFTTIEGEVNATKFIELVKRRQSMEERMVALVEDEETELLDAIADVEAETRVRNAELEFTRRDPAKELEKYMIEVRDRLGRDHAHKLFMWALDELVPGTKKSKK